MEWTMRDANPVDASAAAALRTALDCTEPFAALLVRRGIRTAAQAEAFLNPAAQPLPSPSMLFETERAARRIRKAIAERKRICIYGDYDVDGVCATTIMYRTLATLGADVSYYIPLRAGEGYGLHKNSVRELAESGVQMLITVDNGISAHAEIELGKQLGMEIIVTDHHRCHETLPGAAAVVCASRPGQPEGIASLCGGSVAMLLAMQLGRPAEEFLAIAALATVADVMPLTGFNRTIVARGIQLVAKEPGLMALLEAAGAADRPIDEVTLGFLLAPRLNAAGRMGDARRAVELLIAGDDAARRHFAAELETANAARKAEEQRIFTDAERQVDPTAQHRMLVLCGEDWNPGVIGIVASRIVERYGCPAMLFTRLGGELVGSGRSVPKVDLFGLLSNHASFFTRFGGHAGAAGAAMQPDRFEACRKALLGELAERFPRGLVRPPIEYEDTLALSDCTAKLCTELERLAPFGEGNREPLFRLIGTMSNLTAMGRDGAHLSALLEMPHEKVRLVGFRFGPRAAEWSALKKVETLCNLRKNVFRGSVSVNAYLFALRTACPETVRTVARALLRGGEDGTELRMRIASTARPSEEEMRRIFLRLRGRLQNGARLDELYEEELITLLILREAGIVDDADETFYERTVCGKKDITNGRLYSMLYR